MSVSVFVGEHKLGQAQEALQMCPDATSPLYIEVGQISELSKNASWEIVDARKRYFPQISGKLACLVPEHLHLCKSVRSI